MHSISLKKEKKQLTNLLGSSLLSGTSEGCWLILFTVMADPADPSTARSPCTSPLSESVSLSAFDLAE